jgi:hypothetical protein
MTDRESMNKRVSDRSSEPETKTAPHLGLLAGAVFDDVHSAGTEDADVSDEVCLDTELHVGSETGRALGGDDTRFPNVPVVEVRSESSSQEEIEGAGRHDADEAQTHEQVFLVETSFGTLPIRDLGLYVDTPSTTLVRVAAARRGRVGRRIRYATLEMNAAAEVGAVIEVPLVVRARETEAKPKGPRALFLGVRRGLVLGRR